MRMKYRFAAGVLGLLMSLAPIDGAMADGAMADPGGLIIVEGEGLVPAVADRLVALVAEKGFRVFARVDHAAGAASVDLDLPPSQLIVFGNPKGGTPLMQAAPLTAVALPLKVLVQATDNGGVRLVYDDPVWVADRFGVPAGHPVPPKMAAALAGLTAAALKAD